MERQLFTSVEKLHPKKYVFFRSHASLGLYALLHFTFRFITYFIDMESDMGFDNHNHFHHRNNDMNSNWWNKINLFPLIFLPHFMLQISGFLFTIPTRRHPDGNRIWPQYRAEAFVFFCRCIVLLGLAWYNKVQNHKQSNETSSMKGPFPFIFIHITYPIIIMTMIAADTVAKYYSTKKGGGSRTIRDLKAPGSIRYLMSAAQFHATLHSLMTNDRMSVQMAALAVVQLSAFGMTMRRKGLITQSFGVVLYGCILLIGMIVIWNELKMQNILPITISLGNIAALARFEFRCNKYVLWTIMSIILYIVPKSDEVNDFVMNSNENWKVFGMISSSIWLLVSASNCSNTQTKPNQNKPKMKKV